MRRFFAALLAAAALLTAPALALTEEEMDAAADEAGLAAIAVCVDDGMTDLEKLTVLHDWLALHCDYGATLRGDTPYGALAEGTAVCRGYASGYARLAALAGLDGADTYSESLDHAWILATLDGSRYFSDCTWDDGKNQKLGLIRHTYFLFDAGNAQAVGHYGWDSPEAVPGGPLEDAPWLSSVTRVIFDGDYAWYIDGDFCLRRCDRTTWATETMFSLDDRWPEEEGVRHELYTGLILVRGRLYFNTPTRICYYDLRTGEVKTALTPDTTARRIYGVAERGGTLCYSLADSSGDLLYDVVDTGISLRGAWGY